VVKLDLYARHKSEYIAPRSPAVLTIGAARFLTVAGRGDSNGPAFGAAVGALYGIAYTIKMAKKAGGRDFRVSKLEGLWWGAPRGKLLIDSPVRTWRWKVMIRVPTFVAARDLLAARRTLVRRGRTLEARVQLETLREGRCVQMLHRGPYRAEHPTIAAMVAFARGRGLRPRGRHHEIYLSDPRRVAPAKLRTILRQPVR
jgi:hypothetical protein